VARAWRVAAKTTNRRSGGTEAARLDGAAAYEAEERCAARKAAKRGGACEGWGSDVFWQLNSPRLLCRDTGAGTIVGESLHLKAAGSRRRCRILEAGATRNAANRKEQKAIPTSTTIRQSRAAAAKRHAAAAA